MERTIHELLIVLRDNAWVKISWFGLRQRIYGGLCAETTILFNTNRHERNKLRYYIKLNIPNYKKDNRFGWKPTLWKPRLKWLNKHIELTKPK